MFVIVLHSVLALLVSADAGNAGVVACYLSGVPMKSQEVGCLSQYLTWFDIPTPASLSQLESHGKLTQSAQVAG